MKVKDLPDAERPLFKMRYFGAETLSNTELIQLLTGVSDFETASRILEISDGIQNLYKMSTEEFETIDGVGEATAVRIMASIELNKRYSLPSYKETRIYEAEDVYRMFAAESQGQFQEIVTALLLNAKYEVIGREMISKGGIVSAHVEPCDVYRPAVKRGATGVILVHNHPSGDPTPSEDDITATRQIEKAGELIGVKLIDHVIIGRGRFVSIMNTNTIESRGLLNQKIAETNNDKHEKERER